jgi:type IV secretory pathway VirB10-like protein
MPPFDCSVPTPENTDASMAIEPPEPPPPLPEHVAPPVLPFTRIVPFKSNSVVVDAFA